MLIWNCHQKYIMWGKSHCHDYKSIHHSGEGYVYTMGSNAKGNLGIGDTNTKYSSIPCLVESILENKANKISCGYHHTLLTTDNGEIFSWGDGENGATGFDKTLFEPKQISLFKDKHIFVKRVSCGSRHTAFITCKYS